MSDEEWDANGGSPNGFQPNDKWAGEDQDDDVKDSWDKSDSEEEGKKIPKEEQSKVVKTKTKKSVNGMEKKEVPLTEEEKLTEKLRLQKFEENENLKLARDMCGLKEKKIDSLVPVTKEDFDHFGKAISEKIQMFASSEHYADLVENITRDICVDLKPALLKKLKLYMDSLITAKQKEERAAKSKSKVKVGVKMDLEKDIYGGGSIGGDYDDMDDFM